MKGQQYPIDKSNYRLGRNANNDLCAAADDSVSGDHACLRYQNGGLFLYDQGSRNGTFLNEQRVTGTPLMVRHGDQIRLGESVFEVVGTPSSVRSGGAKDQELKGPGRSVVS
jgi:pSer/pThr/pTyr-binding forkhead associated (FHA) protein